MNGDETWGLVGDYVRMEVARWEFFFRLRIYGEWKSSTEEWPYAGMPWHGMSISYSVFFFLRRKHCKKGLLVTLLCVLSIKTSL